MGASIGNINNLGQDVWGYLRQAIQYKSLQPAQLTPVLRCMLLLSAPTADFERDVHADLRPLLREGRLLRERLPRYLEDRRALIQRECPALRPPGLLEVVMAYAGPLSTEEAWATGVGSARRRREEEEEEEE